MLFWGKLSVNFFSDHSWLFCQLQRLRWQKFVSFLAFDSGWKHTLVPWCILIEMKEIKALYICFCVSQRVLFLEGFNSLACLMTLYLVLKILHWFIFKTHGHKNIVFCMWQRVGNRKDIYPVWKEMFFFSNNFEIEILRHFNFQSDGALNSLRSEILV